MKETPSNPRKKVFISYSHQDKKYLEELHTHLQPYVREGTVDIWDDTKLKPGSNWREEIRQAIASAKIAVLLVSANFLASEFIANNELPPLLAAAKEEGATILIVILSRCAFGATKLAQFQAINDPSRPLRKMNPGERDEVWVKAAERIKDILSTVEPNTTNHKHPVLRANFDHLIETHTKLFAGREEVISKIHNYIADNLNGYIFIEGLSGYGKTSLLAKIVQDHPEFAYHFISQAYRTYGSDFNPTDLEWMMLNLCEQLEQDGSEDFDNLKNPKDRFHHLLRTPSKAKKVIIIDGVDEIDRHPNYLRGVLPTRLPKGVFLIFSARKLGDRDYLEAIGLEPADIQLPIDLLGLDARAIQLLLNEAGGQAILYSNSEPFVDRLYAVSEGDPFYLRFLIEDVAEGIVRPENLNAIPSGLEAYLDMQFEILARSAYLPQQRAILDIVITAHGPLTQDELIYMANMYIVEEYKRYGLQLQGPELLDSFKFDEVIRDIRRFLLENDGMFTFCHKRFKDYFNEKKLKRKGRS